MTLLNGTLPYFLQCFAPLTSRQENNFFSEVMSELCLHLTTLQLFELIDAFYGGVSEKRDVMAEQN